MARRRKAHSRTAALRGAASYPGFGVTACAADAGVDMHPFQHTPGSAVRADASYDGTVRYPGFGVTACAAPAEIAKTNQNIETIVQTRFHARPPPGHVAWAWPGVLGTACAGPGMSACANGWPQWAPAGTWGWQAHCRAAGGEFNGLQWPDGTMLTKSGGDGGGVRQNCD